MNAGFKLPKGRDWLLPAILTLSTVVSLIYYKYHTINHPELYTVEKADETIQTFNPATLAIYPALPEGSFIRDYIEFDDGVYLVLYAVNFDVKMFDPSCTGTVLGQAIEGEYSLAVVSGARIQNESAIPAAFGNERLKLPYKNSRYNTAPGEYTANDPEGSELVQMPLLTFADYTGDRAEKEILLHTAGSGPCGSYSGLVAGLSESDEVVLYSDWLPQFAPKSYGQSYGRTPCSEGTLNEYRYSFDRRNALFRLDSSRQLNCK